MFQNDIIGYLEVLKSTRSIKDKIIKQVLFSILIVFVTLLVVVVLSFWLEKIFSKPIYRLLDAIKNIQKKDDYVLNLELDSKDEFHELYKEFNNMVYEIGKRDALLKKYNLSLEKEVHKTTDKLKKTQSELQEATLLAATDSLTQLANRRVAMQRLEEILSRTRVNAEHVGILMADIDHFKKVNDTYGHQAGDEAIKTVAVILQESIRKSDLAARIGGEEFLVLFENGNPQVVEEIAHRIGKEVRQRGVMYKETEALHITISIGFYSLIPQNETIDEILKVADDALYRAKKSGRDRVVKGEIYR